MEIVTPPCTVMAARVYEPIMFYQHRSFAVEVDLDEQRYTSVRRPLVLDRSGEPLTLKVEIQIGSIVRIHAVDRALLTVQIIRNNLVNPFATLPSGGCWRAISRDAIDFHFSASAECRPNNSVKH